MVVQIAGISNFVPRKEHNVPRIAALADLIRALKSFDLILVGFVNKNNPALNFGRTIFVFTNWFHRNQRYIFRKFVGSAETIGFISTSNFFTIFSLAFVKQVRRSPWTQTVFYLFLFEGG